MAHGHHTPHGTTGAISFDVTLYEIDHGDPVEVHVDPSTGHVWASQSQIANLFDVTRMNVNIHINNLIEAGEIDPETMVKESFTVGSNGQRYPTRLYSHEAILSVGFRVNSKAAVSFRKWARDILVRYQRDGFAIDRNRLADDVAAAKKLTAEIAAIRASNRGITATLNDVLRVTCHDYQSGSPMIRKFFAAVTDMMTFAVTGKTAAGILLERCDGSRDDMGLVSIKGDKPRSSEVETARNYLTEKELRNMNRLVMHWTLTVEGYADNDMLNNGSELVDAMKEAVRSNRFHVFNGYPKGCPVRELADRHVETQFGMWKARNLKNAKPKRAPKPSA